MKSIDSIIIRALPIIIIIYSVYNTHKVYEIHKLTSLNNIYLKTK